MKKILLILFSLFSLIQIEAQSSKFELMARFLESVEFKISQTERSRFFLNTRESSLSRKIFLYFHKNLQIRSSSSNEWRHAVEKVSLFIRKNEIKEIMNQENYNENNLYIIFIQEETNSGGYQKWISERRN